MEMILSDKLKMLNKFKLALSLVVVFCCLKTQRNPNQIKKLANSPYKC